MEAMGIWKPDGKNRNSAVFFPLDSCNVMSKSRTLLSSLKLMMSVALRGRRVLRRRNSAETSQSNTRTADDDVIYSGDDGIDRRVDLIDLNRIHIQTSAA